MGGRENKEPEGILTFLSCLTHDYGGSLIHVFARFLLCVSLFDVLSEGDAQRWPGHRRKCLRAHGTDLGSAMVYKMRCKQLCHHAHNSTLGYRCALSWHHIKLRDEHRTPKTGYA
jgi:hypothetical protein